MGITSSLVTALSGLSTAQSEIDVVGNNIANVNTVGFKSSQLDFKTQFLENFSLGSAPSNTQGGTNPLQIGLGAATGAVTKDFTDGSLEVTGIDTNVAIQGEGMFILQDGGKQVYTRDGSFQLNGLNQLVSGTGALVQGFGVDSNFNVVPGVLGNITIPIGAQTVAQATTTATITGNLYSGGALPTSVSQYTLGTTTTPEPLFLSNGAGGVDPVNPPTAATLLTNVTDDTGTPLFQTGDVLNLSASKGTEALTQTMTVTPTTTLGDLQSFLSGSLAINTTAGANGPVATTPGTDIPTDATNTNAVDLTIAGNPGNVNDIALTASSLTITRGGATLTPFNWDKTSTADGESAYTQIEAYDSLGATVPVNVVATLTSETSSGSTWTYYADSPANTSTVPGIPQTTVGTGTLNFDTSGHLIGNTATNVTINRSQTGADPNLTFSLDFAGTTALATPDSKIAPANVNGLPPGTLQTFTIGTDGTISGNFSNGLSRTVGQIAIATFQNEQGLIDDGNNNYSAGPNSGNAIITTPTSLGSGRLVSGSLELSNVDLSSEFVQLIAASTAFSASSRVISSSNQLLQSLLSAIQG